MFSASGASLSKSQSGANYRKIHTLGKIRFRPWYNCSHDFLSKVNSFKILTGWGIQVANSLGAEQEHNQHALITSLCSLNHLEAIKAYQAKKIRFSQEQTHNLSTTDQTWGTKSIHIYLLIIELSNTECWEVKTFHQPKSNPYWQLSKIKVHFAGIFINPNPINIGTQENLTSKKGDQSKNNQ